MTTHLWSATVYEVESGADVKEFIVRAHTWMRAKTLVLASVERVFGPGFYDMELYPEEPEDIDA